MSLKLILNLLTIAYALFFIWAPIAQGVSVDLLFCSFVADSSRRGKVEWTSRETQNSQFRLFILMWPWTLTGRGHWYGTSTELSRGFNHAKFEQISLKECRRLFGTWCQSQSQREVPRMQTLRSTLLNFQSYQSFCLLKPGLGRNIALHATPSARDSAFLLLIYRPITFNFIFFPNSP